MNNNNNKSVNKGYVEQGYNYFGNGIGYFGNFTGTRGFSNYSNYIPRKMAQGVNHGTRKMYNFVINNKNSKSRSNHNIRPTNDTLLEKKLLDKKVHIYLLLFSHFIESNDKYILLKQIIPLIKEKIIEINVRSITKWKPTTFVNDNGKYLVNLQKRKIIKSNYWESENQKIYIKNLIKNIPNRDKTSIWVDNDVHHNLMMKHNYMNNLNNETYRHKNKKYRN